MKVIWDDIGKVKKPKITKREDLTDDQYKDLYQHNFNRFFSCSSYATEFFTGEVNNDGWLSSINKVNTTD